MNCLAILVNFHCVELVAGAAHALADDPQCDAIHVVDNSESMQEAAWLQKNLPQRAKLIVSEKNVGFGQACNLALQGAHPDSVLLLNPDARLHSGALGSLKDVLRNQPEVGAVGPRVFWDDECHFFMPPSTYPSRCNVLTDILGRRWPWINDRVARHFRRNSVAYWTTRHTVYVSALSGGHVLLRLQALQSVNGLFDPDFFMYWEDSDLMRRLHDGGWRLCMEPRAHAVHWYEHSANKDAMLERGWPVFRDKYFSGRMWHHLFHFVPAANKKVPSAECLTRLTLPATGGEFSINVPMELRGAWLLEISPSRNFVPSIGRFGQGAVARLPALLAARLQDRDYYLRLGRSDGLGRDNATYVFNITHFSNGSAQQG